MLIMSTFILLISNALTHIRELAILLSRSVMYLLFIICILMIDNFNLIFLSRGISIYSGLFFVKPYLETFSFFIYLIAALILWLTSYYPRSFLNPVKRQGLKSQENVAIEKTIQNESLELSTKASLTYFLLGGLSLLILCKEKKIFKWFLSCLCKRFLSCLLKWFLSYICKNPTIILNILFFVILSILDNPYIFLDHYFQTVDSFDSYTIMDDTLNFDLTADIYYSPLPGYKVSSSGNTGNTSNTSYTANSGDSGSGPSGHNGGSGPSGSSGPIVGNGNDSKRKKPSTFFSWYDPSKYGKSIVLTTKASIKRDAQVNRIKKIALEKAKEQAIKKHNMKFYNNNNSIFARNVVDAKGDFIRIKGDHLSQEGLLLNLYRKELYARTKAERVQGIKGKYEDVFPEYKDGRTNVDIFFLYSYHKQVSKEYFVGEFTEFINIEYLKRLNKDIDTD